jgi:hypothetical protein
MESPYKDKLRRQGQPLQLTEVPVRAIDPIDLPHPSRETLLGALTEQSVALVLEAAQHAENTGSSAIESLELFLHQTIDHGPELVLPLYGGPVRLDPQLIALRNDVHATLTRILQRGQQEGTVSPDVTAFDIVIFGAQLARPLPHVRDWQHAARRLVQAFLTGVTGFTASDVPAKDQSPPSGRWARP